MIRIILLAVLAVVLVALFITTGCTPIERGTRITLESGMVLEQREQTRLPFFGGEWDQVARIQTSDAGTSATLTEHKSKRTVDSLGTHALSGLFGYMAGGAMP